MKRTVLVAGAVLVAALAVGGCGKGSRPAASPDKWADPSASSSLVAEARRLGVVPSGPSATTRATTPSTARTTAPSAPAPRVTPAPLGPAGIGPYAVGATLASFTGTGLLDKVGKDGPCASFTTARGTGVYAGLYVVFYNDALSWVEVRDAGYAVAAGLAVGSTRAQVQAAYPAGESLSSHLGVQGVFARSGTNALLFRFDATGKVSSIEAGAADVLRFRFVESEGC